MFCSFGRLCSTRLSSPLGGCGGMDCNCSQLNFVKKGFGEAWPEPTCWMLERYIWFRVESRCILLSLVLHGAWNSSTSDLRTSPQTYMSSTSLEWSLFGLTTLLGYCLSLSLSTYVYIYIFLPIYNSIYTYIFISNK